MLVAGSADVASWPLAADVDLQIVGELARLQLKARRVGFSIELRDLSRELGELLELLGLRKVFREAERREQIGVEEEVEPGDPVA